MLRISLFLNFYLIQTFLCSCIVTISSATSHYYRITFIFSGCKVLLLTTWLHVSLFLLPMCPLVQLEYHFLLFSYLIIILLLRCISLNFWLLSATNLQMGSLLQSLLVLYVLCKRNFKKSCYPSFLVLFYHCYSYLHTYLSLLILYLHYVSYFVQPSAQGSFSTYTLFKNTRWTEPWETLKNKKLWILVNERTNSDPWNSENHSYGTPEEAARNMRNLDIEWNWVLGKKAIIPFMLLSMASRRQN